MKVSLAYGRSRLSIDVPDGATIVEPADPPALADERAGFVQAVRAPIGAPPLRESVAAHERVVIVTSDITRATPNERLLPWILDELEHVPPENITVVIGTGSHRATTPQELIQMFGAATLGRVSIIDHDAHDPAQVRAVGVTSRGANVFLNRRYLDADKRIVVGFIEPHFYAGFSGGPKGIMPGVAGIETVKFFHNAQMVGDPGTRWLNLVNNPIQDMAREVVALAPPHFMVNVTLDRTRAITGFFCGHYLEAHAAGTTFCKAHAARAVAHRFDVVVTTNGGYPLDQNLYQCGKGLTAAAGIVKPGGTIVMCAECSDGLPDHGNFKDLLAARHTPREILEMVSAPGFSTYDQWAAQSQALVQLHAAVLLKSSLPEATARRALLTPIDDPALAVRAALTSAGSGATCAVLTEGPYTVPYLEATAAATH